MRGGLLLKIFFVVYCIEAGVFLIMAPWSPTWDRTVLQLPVAGLRALLLLPLLRSTISGFGLVHLVWGAHDLDSLFARRRRHAAATATGEAAEADA